MHAQGIAIPDQQRDANGRQHDRRQHQLPGQAGKKDHRQPRGQHQQRGAQVRLLQDQRHRQGQQAKGDDKIQLAQVAPSRRWNHQASISGMAIFSSSEG